MKPNMKKIAVGNMGEEELERLQRTVLTREETRAEADLLFGAPAADMRKADRGLLEKLFVQTPGSVTMAPNLQKTASRSGVEMLKLASMLVGGPDGGDSWLKQFEGTDFLPQAIELEEQALMMDKEEQEQRAEDDIRYATQDQSRKAVWAKRDDINFQKRMLALQLAKHQAGMDSNPQEEMHPEGQEAPPQEPPMQEAPPVEAVAQPPMEKSKTSHVDAFFEMLSAPTDAQLRYPELLKVADSGTKKVPNLRPRVTTETTGPTPIRSDLSGGSA
jgi:hypothetical protein